MLQLAFILLTIYVFIWFAKAINYSSTETSIVKRRIIRLGLIFLFWSGYTFLVGYFGILKDTSLPPKMPLLLVFPIFGLLIWFFTSKKASPYLKPIPIYIPLLFQSFRIFVELLIWWSYLKGLTAVEATFEGYNYEIVFGLSALIMGLLAFKNMIGPKLIILWNVIGLSFLSVIVGIFVTLVYFPSIWGYENEIVNPEFLTFPYMYIPAVYMHVAVFTHVFSIIQNKALLKNN